ncbi:MAG: S9 family peptidase [Bryobacteraceae bacterium]|nr:S9 family peptidase [Bryobacteraceae bacterium]
MTVPLFAGAMIITTIATAFLLGADTTPAKMKPPVAAIRPHENTKHGQTRKDPYYWLRERTNPEVTSYLKAENEYLERGMAEAKPLRDTLLNEFRTRIKQTDDTVPYRRDGYLYYRRTLAGKNYQVVCRRKDAADAPEEVLVDGNKEGEGKSYFGLGDVQVSPDTKLLAWGSDFVGRRFYTFRFRDLSTGRELPDVLKDISTSIAWANDNKTIFYTKKDPETLRSYQVWRHVLGTDAARDEKVFEEPDTQFDVGLDTTKTRKFIFIVSNQTLTTEYLYLDADKPDGEFRVFLPRQRNHEYHVDHFGDSFYIRTNDGSKDFRLMKTPVAKMERENWTEVIPHRPGTLLARVEMFKDQMVVMERRAGLVHMEVRPWSGTGSYYIDFGEPAYSASLAENYDLDSSVVRYNYSSLTTPKSVYDFETTSKKKTLLKRDEVLGGFDSANYVTERIYAPAQDGVPVPVSLVYRKTTKRDGSAPLFQYAYGSYGISSDAAFNPFVVSLLDRGFVYAIAHIRGGQENGRSWYEDGKLLKKKNTFRDFISVTQHLVKSKYANAKQVYALGGSAGGLLMGAVMNMRPDLYHGIIAAVPFVDVVTTMLDDTIPLTTFEYDEWGNPNDQTYYEYMMTYSPYDNVEKKAYPNLLVTTGLHDSQVQYWEPAKWVAKLRAMKTDSNSLYLYTNMDAGHGGASARYKRYEEIALQYAFLLTLAGRA